MWQTVLVLGGVLVAGQVSAQTGPWTELVKRDAMAYWQAGMEVGMLDDARAELIQRCRTDWTAPYALRLTHAESGERITVICDEVRE